MVTDGSRRIRVLIVDDNDTLRFALGQVFKLTEDLEVVGEASDGQQAIELTHQLLPDVILMDLIMPRMNGVEATAAIHQHYPQITILVLTSGTEPELIDQALAAGAKSYLLKQINNDEIPQAIRKIW